MAAVLPLLFFLYVAVSLRLRFLYIYTRVLSYERTAVVLCTRVSAFFTDRHQWYVL